eukprot:scaffold26586_cov107-Amphora_coffeaeformis.AAC.1
MPSFRPISNGELWQPLEVIPPKITTPEFVCSEHWLSDVELEIIACLQRSDAATDQQDDDRIPPKALVRCSRGGKKRTLYAITNRMKGYNKSLLDGDWGLVPKELYILVDATQNDDGITPKIRWLPYHLMYVLGQLGTSIYDKSKLEEKLSDLCNLIKEAKEQSGKGWEGLFVLFLVAHYLNKCSDGVFVPAG